MGIFKAYDIRGIYGEEITRGTAFRVAKAFGSCHPGASVLVGHDARIHSGEMYRELIRGLLESGSPTAGTGLTSTPALHFGQMRLGYDFGVMVTASHNPGRYHGFKFFDSLGGTVSYDKGLREVEEAYNRSAGPVDDPPGGEGARKRGAPAAGVSEVDVSERYLAFLTEAAAASASRHSGGGRKGGGFPQKVVIDASNGSAGRIFSRLAQRLGLNAELMNLEPDGRFPNHPPNPLLEESRRGIGRRVRESGADLGVLLDGDGDRIIFLDERGEALEGYFAASLMAEELLRRSPGSAVVYDLISSRSLPERIRSLGGTPVVSKVGYTFIFDKMVQADAVLGCETSGHFYFRVEGISPQGAPEETDRRFYTESAAYALLVMLRHLSGRDERLSELVDPLRGKYSQAPERNLRVEDKTGALRKVERRYADGEISRLDGLSVAYEDFWFNLRASNTEPLLRLRLEAVDEGTARRRSQEISDLINSEVNDENTI